MDNTFGKNLEIKRKEKNLSQGGLEERSGISQSHISCLERGVKQPTLIVLKKLAAALEITVEELIEDIHPTEDSLSKTG